ncbi:MAG: outer membrane beta-barrel protein [Blastochloris sp.]|nr:outer membrane beta-barrel protein [Blastochloris sp.]
MVVLSFSFLCPDISAQSEDYNVKAGPVQLKIVSGLRTTYNDNINLSEFDRLDDIIFSPYTNLTAVWPVTDTNTLRVGLGISYNKYLNNSQADSNAPILSADSNTGADLDIVVGDFRFNIYDYISYEQDPIDNGALSNTLDFGRFINRAGVDGTWDLNDVELTLGIYQENYWSMTDQFDYLDRSTQGAKGRVAFQLGPETVVGVQANASLNDYDGNIQNDGTRFSVGPFIRSKITENISAGAGASFELGSFDRGGLNGDDRDLTSYSLNGDVSHRLNRHFTHDLSVTRSVDLGTFSNFEEIWEVRYNTRWNVMRHVMISTTSFVEFADESGGFASDDYIRYGSGVSLGYAWTKKLTSTLSYNYTKKESQIFGRDYYQNTVSLDLRYNW